MRLKDSQLVVASSNAGKLRELSDMLSHMRIEVIGQRALGVADVPETGTTFVENALIKARHACEQTGLGTLADDSGLCVPALDGAPGIYSARYAGEHASDQDNLEYLLARLDGVSRPERRAFFCCTLVLMRHAADPMPLICQGRWAGHILLSAQGNRGFGYDPVFMPDGASQSAAQMSREEKNRQSHRGLALRALQAEMSPG